VLGLPPQITVSVSGLTIRNAEYGISNNQGTVSVSNCVISGNSVAGLYNYAGNAGQGSVGASMTVANSIISNNSGTGAYNVFPFQGSASNTLARNPADQRSDGAACACMTITDSVVSNNNADGISNTGNTVFGPANLTVANSNVSDNDGTGISNNGCDGSATATIVSTTVRGNSAGGVETFGLCGLFGAGQVTITNSTISGNSANGGIRSGLSALTVANSTISGNSSGDTGGGIWVSSFAFGPHVSIVNSTFSGNSAGTSGGGIYGALLNPLDTFSIVNSTVSGNSAGTSGGGIYNLRSSLYLANSTITGNSAGSGGGIYDDGGQFGDGIVQISNTILNAGASGENIFNSGSIVASHGYNLSSDDGAGYLNGPGDQINTDPLLGPLQNNGGPTFTHRVACRQPCNQCRRSQLHSAPFVRSARLSFRSRI
jgi:predicted outer membrane repeat protein